MGSSLPHWSRTMRLVFMIFAIGCLPGPSWPSGSTESGQTRRSACIISRTTIRSGRRLAGHTRRARGGRRLARRHARHHEPHVPERGRQ